MVLILFKNRSRLANKIIFHIVHKIVLDLPSPARGDIFVAENWPKKTQSLAEAAYSILNPKI